MLNKLSLNFIMILASFTLSAFVVGVGYISISANQKLALEFHRISSNGSSNINSQQILSMIDSAQKSVGIASAIGFLMALGAGFFFSYIISARLIDIGNQLFKGSQDLVGFSSQLFKSSSSLSSNVMHQASSLQETSAALVQLSKMVELATTNSQMALETSKKSENSASSGKKTVTKMIESIEDINSSNKLIMKQVDSSNEGMSEILKIMTDISNKAKIINDIVFQSRILSFNASIEAARAGEHGKGFSVVAEEVGNLAKISGEAAEEMSKLLIQSNEKVKKIVHETRSNTGGPIAQVAKKVEQTTLTAHQCGEVLGQIVEAASAASVQTNEISKASEEQNRGVQEINRAVAHLEEATHENSNSANQGADIAAQLDAHAKLLKSEVEELFRAVRGNKNSKTNDAA